MKNDFKLNIPLKETMPTLEYDYSLYCELLMTLIPGTPPDYMRDFNAKLFKYENAVKKTKPATYPDAYRVYLIDNRLNILFAAHDTTGEIGTWFSKYGLRGWNFEAYLYGDGQLIGGLMPGESYNIAEMQKVNKKLGFLPVEELALTAALVFDGDTIEERRLLSQYQTALLMEKFRADNLVDWEALALQAADATLF